MDPSTNLIPYLNSSSLIVFGIVHVANVAHPMISNTFMNYCLFKYNKVFCGRHVILKRNVYTDKGGGCGKAGIVYIYHKIYEWHLITQTNYTEQVLQLRL